MIIVSKNTQPDIIFAIYKASQEEEITPLYNTNEYAIHKFKSIEYQTTEIVTRKDENGDDIQVVVDVIKKLIPGDIFTNKGLKIAFENIISSRQFFTQLGIEGIITGAEVMAKIKDNDLPEIILAFVENFDDEKEKEEVLKLLYGAQDFRRDHAMVQLLGMVINYDDNMLDQIWIDGAKLQ